LERILIRRRCNVAWLLLTWLFAVAAAHAQDLSISGIPVDGSATIEQLDAVIAEYESRDDLGEEVRNSTIERLRDARAQVQNRNASAAAEAEFSAALDSAPAEIERLQLELEEVAQTAVTADDLGITDRTTLSELEQLLAREQANLAAAESELARLETQVSSEEARPAAARDRIADLRGLRDELAAAASAEAAPGQPAQVAEAARLAASLRLAAHAAEIRMLEQELLSQTARVNLLNLQRDLAARNRLESERRLDVIRAEVNRQRQASALLAQQAAAAAELAAADKHPVVRELAEGNANLTSELPALAGEIESVTERLDELNAGRRELEERLARSRQRVEIGGLSRAIGELLEEERRNLPQVSRYRGDVRSRSSLLANIGLSQLRIQEERRGLSPLEAAVERTIEQIGDEDTDEEEIAGIREEVRLLLRDRRDLLAQAERTYTTYLQALADTDSAQRELLSIASDYQDFLRQHQIWIPSAPVLGLGEWRDVGPALQWAFSAESWRHTAAALADSLYQNLAASFFVLVLFAIVVLLQRPLHTKHKSMSERVGRLSTDNIWLTVGSLGIAAVRALPLPLLIGSAAWFLKHSVLATPFTLAVGGSLGALAPFLYNLMLVRVLSAKGGVLDIHFRWSEAGLMMIRRQLDRMITLGSPLIFATVLFYLSELAGDRATLGRLSFVLLMALLSSVIHPLANPKTGVASSYYAARPEYWVTKLRWVWYGIGAAGPIVLAALSILGYLYTSLIMTVLLVDTIWLVIAMIVINMVVLRWLVLARRKLALKRLLEEREARRAEKDAEDKSEDEGEAPEVQATQLDLDDVDQQTRRILRSGLFFLALVVGWGIWAEVLPAFSLFNEVSLWSKMALIDGVETIAPVTLADVMLAIVVAAVTAIAYRNLPGLMEITVLQRLTLQPGSRYTINTLVRYGVVTVGVFSVLNIVGWNWSQIQWLVAALSVGLGFGLQEIVANFVSGLIILFERPVRVGDTVTVGQLSGTVSRVRIRATTITDWDRKEIIVPNKSFITEQVVNWTLSDPITRVVIPVGISYGSDVELAHRVMDETLKSLPLVLDEPEPKVYFMGFGDSSLDFKLYVFSRQLGDRLPIMNAVHEAILKALRENDIEIPFPQRDLHVRSTVEQSDDRDE
jgi:potassium efflux system protein